MEDAIARLEKWKSGHKARSVRIDIDNGYGATCWVVDLCGRDNKKVTAAEVAFIATKPEQVPEHVVFVVPPDVDDKDEDWDWPGLGPTIHAALDRAEKLGL